MQGIQCKYVHTRGELQLQVDQQKRQSSYVGGGRCIKHRMVPGK